MMPSTDWKSALKSVAPTIAAGLGGPLAGAAVAAISKAVLGKDAGSDDELANAIIGASPEVLESIRKAEYEFKARMAQLNVNVFELEVQDRSNARELFRVNHWPQIIFSALFIVGYFVMVILLALYLLAGVGRDTVRQIPHSELMVGAFITLLGVMTGEIPRIMSFWFGSTSGGQAKTNLLAQAGKVA